MISRLSISDPVIYTDKTPKSLYEFYLNGYKESDIMNLINNLRMDFDDWDKTVNLYKTSKTIEVLSNGDISIIYEDFTNNAFIYSFATKQIYFYDKDTPPYIKLEDGMSINSFLQVAKRDFEALLRTPYGKKYVSECSVLVEGIREVFGFGKAIRIFLDGKKDDKAMACSEFTYACLDALFRYSPNKIISLTEFRNLCARNRSICEVYTNRKLGASDHYRMMVPDEEAIEEIKTGETFESIMHEFGQEPGKIYATYMKSMSIFNILGNVFNYLGTYCKKNTAFAAAVGNSLQNNKTTFFRDFRYLDFCSWTNSINILELKANLYAYAVAGKYKSGADAFKKATVTQKLLNDLNTVVIGINSFCKNTLWRAHCEIDAVKSEFETSCDANISIVLQYSGYDHEVFHYMGIEKAKKQSVPMKIKSMLFEYFTGTDPETYEQDSLRMEFGDLDELSDEEIYTQFEDEDLKDMLMDEDFDEAALTETFEMITEGETTRAVAHAVRTGIEKTAKAVHDVKTSGKEMIEPIASKIKDTIEGIQKEHEDESREIIITNSDFARLRRLFSAVYALPVAAGYFFGPIAAIVTFLGTSYLKTDDKKMRNQIVRELELELKITKEKIEDARSNGDKSDKYQLMRIESKIEDQLADIKYGR